MKSILPRLKPLIRWVILGASVFFLVGILRQNWRNVTSLHLDGAGWACLAIALGITLSAHICAGWVWSQTLRRDFQQLVDSGQIIQAYLQTNIAKYLPGNIWHYYGRINAATAAGASLEAATVTVLLEPLLMAAAALLVGLSANQTVIAYGTVGLWLQWLGLVSVLLAIHPRAINPVIAYLSRLKQKTARSSENTLSVRLLHYPVLPLLGGLGFLLLRGGGFLITFWAIAPFNIGQVPLLLSGFSLSWLIGLLVPGAPGGIGVFEATAIALLSHDFQAGLLLGVVALYRLVSVTSEAMGAGLAWLDEQMNH
ncbi:flippase-like domain-containing protein [Phormidium sp. CLA17]|uniref:lysylphosphatidylglycerol synthase domain-containing protein n=1 Tax=Leptolyngbya sp. Cla-17 TaxID=2803751 RepID=UPI001491984F|nr:lysylphosphatidylglycerol synthase domain-containing protein [Leptolyngbya sp. Cla-17]MBM0741039.1 flippase-like domain-containing protein [Leptolyngbya sp. Cla-17]